jgi:hypothetical protein
VIEIFDMPQGSPEWYQARLGIPTASEFSVVMAKQGPRGGTSHKEYVGRTTYLRKLAGEIMTGQPMDSYSNANMERGKEREDEARALYSMLNESEITRVGFIKNGNCGCSPDSLVGDDGGLEIKDALPHVQIARLLDGHLPAEHKAQVMGSLKITGRAWWDFMSHCRGLPPLIVRVQRDEQYIAELTAAVDAFAAELAQLVEWLRRM